jgi:UDP-N-acetylglucosamine 2-epimerase (non-hydrolysing)
MKNILLVAGARPNFMKIMPLIREFKKHPKNIKYTLVHTGQHYDNVMSEAFFSDLKLPKPDIHLGVGSATHGKQTAKIIEGIERILLKGCFDLVIVVGDVNSTIAAALSAVKLNIKVAHVEAGLRSFDREMPEEINRVLTDHISDYLFTTEDYGNKNLIKEGIPLSKIFFVGDIMIDAYYLCRPQIAKSKILSELCLKSKSFALVTMHRPSNVDNKKDLKNIVDILKAAAKKINIVFPIHPRTDKMLKIHGLNLKGITVVKPLGYVDFHKLLEESMFVMTDSGGIQEETTVMNIPCLTLRATTERPVTVERGTNLITGTDKAKILKAVDTILNGKWKKPLSIPKWDGKAASRITKILLHKRRGNA